MSQSAVTIWILIDASEFAHFKSSIEHVRNLANSLNDWSIAQNTHYIKQTMNTSRGQANLNNYIRVKPVIRQDSNHLHESHQICMQGNSNSQKDNAMLVAHRSICIKLYVLKMKNKKKFPIK